MMAKLRMAISAPVNIQNISSLNSGVSYKCFEINYKVYVEIDMHIILDKVERVYYLHHKENDKDDDSTH